MAERVVIAAPWIVAHRGASGSAPENTRAALERARALGAPWVEVDVQRTADGVLVLVHDDTWERTGGLSRPVAATPWERVRHLDVGGWFGPEFAGERPLRLAEALVLAGPDYRFDLEIKSPEHHPGLGLEVVAAVRQARCEAHVLLTCFDAEVVESLAEAAPDLRFGYLSAAPLQRSHPRVRTLVLHHQVLRADPQGTQRARAAGCDVLAWTVDDPREGHELLARGATGIVTNHPERFLA